jgi:DNA-binding NarL/FixJ family response regulator
VSSISVFLCDDTPELRELTRFCIEEADDMRVVGEAGDAESGVEQIEQLEPDVVLLDLSMPGVSGLEAIRRIRVAAPRTAIVILSGMSKARAGDVCLALGAVEYVEKREPMERVREAVRDAAGGELQTGVGW